MTLNNLLNGDTIAVAESLTGGMLGEYITDVAGASSYFLGGVIAYSNHAKSELLGVDPELIQVAGAVCADVAIAMAQGARDRFDATWGIATTGVAGPDPIEGKPVGTVYIAVAGPQERVLERHFEGDRRSIREQAARAALELLETALTHDRGK